MSDTPAAQYRHGHDEGGTVNGVRQQKDGEVHSWLPHLPDSGTDGALVHGAQPHALRVLVACEYSAVVRDAFRRRGFNAWSCDLLPTEGDPRWHIQGDALDAIHAFEWDLLIAHPPCTHLAVSGARWFKEKQAEQAEALAFVRALLDAPVPHIALENPVSIISSRIRKPDCTFQPWQHGHGEVKRTCLWLKNLPVLKPSNVVEGREARVHKMPPGPDRWKERSRTFAGVAEAMADQWGGFLNTPKGITPDYSLQGIAYAGNRITGTYAENRISGPVHDTRGDLPKALAASDFLTFHSTDLDPEVQRNHGA